MRSRSALGRAPEDQEIRSHLGNRNDLRPKAQDHLYNRRMANRALRYHVEERPTAEARAYAVRRGLELMGRLGDGAVWGVRSKGKRIEWALKIHTAKAGYRFERDAHMRLLEHEVRRWPESTFLYNPLPMTLEKRLKCQLWRDLSLSILRRLIWMSVRL